MYHKALMKCQQAFSPRPRDVWFFAGSAYGDSAPELERVVLDQALRFFGEGARLEVVPGYTAVSSRRAAGSKGEFFASISIRCLARGHTAADGQAAAR